MQKGRLKRECEWKAAVCHLTACCIESFYAHAQNNQNSCTFPPCPGQFFKHLLNGLSMAGERKKQIHTYVCIFVYTYIHTQIFSYFILTDHRAFKSSDRRIANEQEPFLAECNLTLVYYGKQTHIRRLRNHHEKWQKERMRGKHQVNLFHTESMKR